MYYLFYYQIPGGFHFATGAANITEDANPTGHMALSHLRLAFVLMLRPFILKLVMSTDLFGFEHPLVLLFCLEGLRTRTLMIH